MTFDKRDIQHARLVIVQRSIIGLDSRLHDSLERSSIAADLDLVVVRGDRRLSHRRHLKHSLRLLKTLERPLPQWI